MFEQIMTNNLELEVRETVDCFPDGYGNCASKLVCFKRKNIECCFSDNPQNSGQVHW